VRGCYPVFLFLDNAVKLQYVETMEIWKEIPKFEKYEVSDLGRVRRVGSGKGARPGLILKQKNNIDGYLQVQFFRKNLMVHRLVLSTFLGEFPDGKVTNHIDGNKRNNKLKNLEFCTRRENMIHAIKVLKVKMGVNGEKHPNSKLKETDIPKIFDLRRRKWTCKKIGLLLGVTESAIHNVISGRTWKHLSW